MTAIHKPVPVRKDGTGPYICERCERPVRRIVGRSKAWMHTQEGT